MAGLVKPVKRIIALTGLLLVLLLVLPFSQRLSAYAKQAVYGNVTENSVIADGVKVLVTLQEGDYLLFGRYLEEPILWRVISMEAGKPLLFSERVLCFKAFAACENPLEGLSDWQGSALRQWLNCTESHVPWTGTPPESANVYEGYNGYAEEPGFLSNGNFSGAELALIENNGDWVFLLTKKQLQKLPTGQRQKSPTQAALRHDDSPYINLRPTCWYWTADPIDTNMHSVCSVTGKGGFYKSLAADGMNGVCPALYFASAELDCVGGDGSGGNPYKIMG